MFSVNRRDFVKGVATGVGISAFAFMGLYSYSPLSRHQLPKTVRKQFDFGSCQGVKVTCISETSWFDNSVLMKDIHDAGGLLVNQYDFNWPPFGNGKGIAKGSYTEGIEKIKHLLPERVNEAWELTETLSINSDNPGGFSALVEVLDNDGVNHKYLLDCGWSYAWMDECFQREGIDKMLADGEIEALIFSHEHFDHFWGLPVALKYRRDIPIYVPHGFYEEGFKYIKDSGHSGDVIEIKDEVSEFIPGMVLMHFGVPIICRTYGEMSMAFNVAGKGLVIVSGCCHQGIIQLTDSAYRLLKYDKDQFHGLYGGLHISPFEDWDPKYDDLVISLQDWNFEKIGCNHCTGIMTANKLLERGYPLVKGTAKNRSKSKAYLGNGDNIGFGVYENA
ncbi:MBL fold metallo-hydrolase [Shewanella chilikensis]|uniref:MBL fold metallo-hydrolase n=1 Tax=Shewanella chilikensis TaxID=558541 RepID=UPI001F1621A5|nr:MBL fold metallo-hydrolase [Shewanella chilikensis]MCE9786612.1 MBL fold metallo-hydrolase [Shewanella chilikensis]